MMREKKADVIDLRIRLGFVRPHRWTTRGMLFHSTATSKSLMEYRAERQKRSHEATTPQTARASQCMIYMAETRDWVT